MNIFENPSRVIFEGDSLTDGLRDNTGRIMGLDRTWAHIVDEWILLYRPKIRIESRNMAVGGSTASNTLECVSTAEAFRPEIAMFTIGTNDCNTKVSIVAFSSQLDEWCRRMKSARCRCFIHVGGFPICPHADKASKQFLAKCGRTSSLQEMSSSRMAGCR